MVFVSISENKKMPRSRSRDKRRSRDRRSRSRDHKRKDRSLSRDRHNKRNKSPNRRDRHETSSYDRRDRSSERHYSSRHRERSADRSKKRNHSRDRKRDRSTSRLRKHRKSSSVEKQRSSTTQQSSSHIPAKPTPVQVTNEESSSSHEPSCEKLYDPRNAFEIANEFSREGFELFTRQNGIDFSNIETEDDRVAVHEKMEELLKEHFAAQGKVYPPPKVEKPVINAATGFMNDGSFLEQFKKMQDEYKQQQEMERKKKLAEERLKSLPIRRRAGGKILKTGIVAKTKMLNEDGSEAQPADAWSIYLKEVQKYKNASCDSDSKTRPLVK